MNAADYPLLPSMDEEMLFTIIPQKTLKHDKGYNIWQSKDKMKQGRY